MQKIIFLLAQENNNPGSPVSIQMLKIAVHGTRLAVALLWRSEPPSSTEGFGFNHHRLVQLSSWPGAFSSVPHRLQPHWQLRYWPSLEEREFSADFQIVTSSKPRLTFSCSVLVRLRNRLYNLTKKIEHFCSLDCCLAVKPPRGSLGNYTRQCLRGSVELTDAKLRHVSLHVLSLLLTFHPRWLP